MLHYFRLAVHNVLRNKGFAVLNIVGFSIGLGAFLLVVFFVADELSYDRYNAHHDRIYRVDTDLKYGDVVSAFALAAPPVAKALRTTFEEVETAVRLSPALGLQFRKGNELIREDGVLYADESLFDVFSFYVMDGDVRAALSTPSSTVITDKVALKYFGTTAAAGRTMLLADGDVSYTVAAVVAAMPAQSHFHADIFLPLTEQANANGTSYTQFSFNTYVLLKDRDQAAVLQEKLASFLRSHLGADMNVDAFESGGNYIRLSLMPLRDIHLYSNKQRELESNSSVSYVYIFSAIAVLIIFLACINFINLFTARSAARAREVGIRKILGTKRRGIIAQFMVEAWVMTGISALAAVLCATLALPAFNFIAGKQLMLDASSLIWLIPLTLVVTVAVGLLAGTYPAFFLSSFHPVAVLKGKFSFRHSGIRNILVIFQFGVAAALVLSTGVIFQQMRYIQERNVGYIREQILIVNNVVVTEIPQTLKEEVLKLPGVLGASLSGYLPTGGGRWTNNISSGKEEGFLTEFWPIDHDYIATLEMELLEGRNFSASLASDSLGIIVNQTAAARLGYHENAVGRTVQVYSGKKYTIVGVVKDFNFNSLRENVAPLVMVLGQDWRASLVVRIASGNFSDVLDRISKVWKSMNPGHAFEFSVMDKDFESLYFTEKRMQRLFGVFAVFALGIAALGLFGLSAYAAEQRTRELSIRKVLGASGISLFTLVSKEYIKLIMLSVVIALPLSWIAMTRWLGGFAYKTEIPWWIPAIVVLLVFCSGFITLTFQTAKVVRVNPADHLRNQ